MSLPILLKSSSTEVFFYCCRARVLDEVQSRSVSSFPQAAVLVLGSIISDVFIRVFLLTRKIFQAIMSLGRQP